MTSLRHFLLYCLVGCGITAALTACSDDDLTGLVPDANPIRIVQNDLLFTADGNSATVVVDATGTIAAQTDAPWCTATVSGKTITVTAEANHTFDGRTALLTVTAGDASRQLPVQQEGMVLDLPLVVAGHHAPRQGEVYTIPLQHNVTIDLTASQDWLHPVMDGNNLRVTIDDNTGGHIRRGFVALACGDFRDTLRIAQFDMQDDILGSYYLMGYYGGDPNTPQGVRFDVIQRNDSLLMHWPQEQYAQAYIPLTLDETTCTLFIPSGFVLRSSSTSTTYGYFYDTNGRVGTAAGVGATVRLSYYESQDYNGGVLVAANWAGHTLGGFIIYLSSAFVSQTILQLGSPVLMRVGPAGTTLSE